MIDETMKAADSRGASLAATPACVAQVLPWKAIGGTELATLRVARAAAVGGFRSIMFCRTDAPLVRNFFTEHGFDVETFDPAKLEGGLLPRIAEWLKVMRRLRQRGIRVVHCADVYGGDLLAIAARLAGCAVVCHVRNRYAWLTLEQRVWLRLVSKVVFVSKHTADHFGRLSRGMPDLSQKRRVLYDGIATTALSTSDPQATRDGLGIPADAVVIGMIARMSIQKDHLTLVKAAAAVCRRHPRAFFVFVGDDGQEGGAEPENARRVRQAIDESPDRSRFLCTGFRSDVPDLIAALDVFVLSTHREGLPLVILEAMAQGKPVVATAVDGIPEIVQHEATGLLHDHEDAQGLADRINVLLDDPVAASALGTRGKSFVDAAFSQDAFEKNVCALYRGLVDGAAPREALHDRRPRAVR